MTIKNAFILLIFLCSVPLVFGQKATVLESTRNSLTVEIDFLNSYSFVDTVIEGKTFQRIRAPKEYMRNMGEPHLPDYYLPVGIPPNTDPTVKVLSTETESFKNKMIMPSPKITIEGGEPGLDILNEEIYYRNAFFPDAHIEILNPAKVRYATILPVTFFPFRYNPVTKELIFTSKMKVKITYGNNGNIPATYQPLQDAMTLNYLRSTVINYEQARNWISKEKNTVLSPDEHWYDPAKSYYRLYLNERGVYKITFEELSNAGLSLGSGVPSSQMAMFHLEDEIPIEVNDGGDGSFEPGDFIAFVGLPAPSSPNSYQNIYNNSNVYFITHEQTEGGLHYTINDAKPQNYQATWGLYTRVDHYEEDQIYEHLGYAPNGNRDHWFWAKATMNNGVVKNVFRERWLRLYNFAEEYRRVQVRVDMHGMTTTSYLCDYIHSFNIVINDQYVIGNAKWNGQTQKTWEGSFWVGTDSVITYYDGNYISVIPDGEICLFNKNDDIRVNWYELEYKAWHRPVSNEQYYFKSDPNQTGSVMFWITNWLPDSMRVFVPDTKELLLNGIVEHNVDQDAFFQDTVAAPTEYFIVGENNYLTIDSIKQDMPSDLRSASNGADYIIITHSSLRSVADRLKNFRQNNFPDTSITNPRIKIIDVQDIYDQFSGGLLNPYAIKDFVKFAFEWWTAPAPAYLTLIGDMSHDYRGILPDSRPNFIPSIPYHSVLFGEAPSDNGFVAINGEDVLPDLILGRISIESVQEGNDYLYKVENYPSDPDKKWKEKVMLLASGLNEEDERKLGFNDESLKLDSLYIKPNGYNETMVFRYPSKPDHYPYLGSTPEIRTAFDNGAVLCNYYGHGGGYQWDLTFLNDDIYLLNNQGKLPVVVSVTCYTAHFDNQDVFGEQFIKVPEKGAVGFFGSSGLTHWQIGTYFNGLFFSQIFNQKNYVTGQAILNAKGNMPGFGYYANQIALLTYLGEPMLKLALPSEPDFAITTEDISITPNNAILGDSLQIKFNMNNYGILVDDSINVQVSFQTQDTSGLIADTLIPVFGNKDSLTLKWIPEIDGLIDVVVELNKTDPIDEPDYNDNSAKVQTVVYNLSEPSVVGPVDGFTTTENKIGFRFVDIGHYIDLDLEYHIEIDTTLDFSNPLYKSGTLYASNGLLDFQSPELMENKGYYWRARIFDGNKFGRWMEPRTFQIMQNPKAGYYISGDQLKNVDMDAIVYKPSTQALSLDITLQPPKPSTENVKNVIHLSHIPMDDTTLSCITTDGKYYYVGNQWYWALNNNILGKSKIYKIGTGHQGTVRGQSYGEVPGFFEAIRFQFFYHSDGFLYVPTNDPHKILKVDPETGNIDTSTVEAGFIEYNFGTVTRGDFHLTSDSQYVYNISFIDSMNQHRYTLRIFDPTDNWRLVQEKYYPFITSYIGFSGFFVANGYFYPYENYYSGFMRRIRIEDGYIDREWITYAGDTRYLNRFYAWTYDWTNDEVAATQFRPHSTLDREIWQFKGHHFAARGEILSNSIGQVKQWNTLHYEIDDSQSDGSYNVMLEGFDRQLRKWDTLSVNTPTNFDLRTYDPRLYNFMRIRIAIQDSAVTAGSGVEIKNFGIDYTKLPELHVSRNLFTFQPDSVLQGLNMNFISGTRNIGFTKVDSAKISFYLNNTDSLFYTDTFSLEADSLKFFGKEFNTTTLILGNRLSSIVETSEYELFTFNNAVFDSFYVTRDSLDPVFKITFDGQDILNGDIISDSPDILISLQDNSPLPLDTNYFTLLFDNVPLNFNRPDLQYSYTPYPNSEAQILWQPKFESGRHTLDILAKDASNNFFDTTYHRSVFYVYTEEDIVNFYNYPNPFEEDTYFTYELHGSLPPEELRIKIFTVAGRLIREMTIPYANHNIGYNTFYWNGRDEDGDEIANGVYFYKVIAKYPEETKTFINKIVKMQ